MIELTDEMVYAFAGEPEITATDAHAISVGLRAVLALVERDRAAEQHAAADAEQERADRLIAETGIAGMDIHDGAARLRLVLAHELAAEMTRAFKTILDAHPGVENYIEQELTERNGGGRYVFIVCKPGGKTPHQLRRVAEDERDALRAELTALINDQAGRP